MEDAATRCGPFSGDARGIRDNAVSVEVMTNPFERRVTEYVREVEAFLSLVSPEPILAFLKKPAQNGSLYDRLAVIIGTPGSGKTTIAKLFQYETIVAVLRNANMDGHRPLLDALTQCGAICDDRPTLIGCRLPLESEYREFWEFPYPEDLKAGLMTALLQSRAVLGWLRNFRNSGTELANVLIVPRAGSEAGLDSIGGPLTEGILNRAEEVEQAVYGVVAALIPPDLSMLPEAVKAAYRPFDVIESFEVSDENGSSSQNFQPLVMFDDAHVLHPRQRQILITWLSRRELKIARWVLTRLDVLKPTEVLSFSLTKPDQQPEDGSGTLPSREIKEIWLQSGSDRRNQRQQFRSMARDMASRYLAQMPAFSDRGIRDLGDILSTTPNQLAPGRVKQLKHDVESAQRSNRVSAKRRTDLEGEIRRFYDSSKQEDYDAAVSMGMLRILMHRYGKRVPQASLFEEENGAEPSRPVTAASGVADGARIHLLHQFDRPYFYGIDAICDAASENAEQFLQLASRVVDIAETRLIRGRPASLDPILQNRLLRERAAEIIATWNFPQHQLVKKLADGIAKQCLAKSLEPNASLGGGPNAVGIIQEEFDELPHRAPALAQILQYGIAHNVFVLVPKHGAKKRLWCLVELGGLVLLRHGLTLRRGGFLERRVTDLNEIIKA